MSTALGEKRLNLNLALKNVRLGIMYLCNAEENNITKYIS